MLEAIPKPVKLEDDVEAEEPKNADNTDGERARCDGVHDDWVAGELGGGDTREVGDNKDNSPTESEDDRECDGRREVVFVC